MSTDYEPPPDDSLFVDEEAPGWTPRRDMRSSEEIGTVANLPGWFGVDAASMIYKALDRIATALEALAQNASRPPSAPVSAPTGPSAQGMPSNGPGKPEKTLEQKRGGLIFYACKDNGWAGKSDEVGANVLGYMPAKDARQWTREEQTKVLDAMKEWGWVKDRG